MVEDRRQIDAINSFWASSLGCDTGSLAVPGLTICRKIAASDREEIFVFRRDETYVVKVQEKSSDGAIYSAAVDMLNASPLDALLDGTLWNDFVKLPVVSTVGPAYVGYLYDDKLYAHRGASARILSDEDQVALYRLSARCPAIEWEHSGIEFDRRPIFGCPAGGEIVSASSFVIWGREIAHIGVITDPSHRRRGFGKAAVSAACGDAISKGLIPQYRTLKSNTASIEIARALGFEEYATTLCIVLGPN